ncbi:hypothetical protein B0H11DRAFT_2018189 [Mycena galericulata]|nr:hypothetical protein B0H11DRAFT_2018189 [Mycena galericulata]
MPAAPTTAFVVAQEKLQAAESEASFTSSRARSAPGDADLAQAHTAALARADAARAARDAAAHIAYEPAATIVNDVLNHYFFSVGPTVPAALATAMLQPSFCDLAQQLEDAAAPINVIIAFRQQWRRFHSFPDAPHGTPSMKFFVGETMAIPTFGAAIAPLVDEHHISDEELHFAIFAWRRDHGEQVLERGESSMPLTLQAMHRLALF